MLFLSYLGAIAFGLSTSNAAGAIGSAAFGSFGFRFVWLWRVFAWRVCLPVFIG